MKNIKLSFFFITLLILLTGCQAGSTVSMKDEMGDNNESLQMSKINIGDNSNSSEDILNENNIVGVGSKQTTDDLEITLLNVRNITVENISASKDWFLGVELLIENKTDQIIEIASLPQLNLIVNNENQDIALIDTKGKLNSTIEPGASITGEIAFDSVKSDKYVFIYKNLNNEEYLTWHFSQKDINISETNEIEE